MFYGHLHLPHRMRHQPSIGHVNLNIKNVHVSSAQAQMEKKPPFLLMNSNKKQTQEMQSII